MLSLISYSATDPCFSVSGAGAKNYIGIIGAYLSTRAAPLRALAYFIPFFLFGYRRVPRARGEAVHPHLKKIGGLVSSPPRPRSSASRAIRSACSERDIPPAACSAAPSRICSCPASPQPAHTSSRLRPSCCLLMLLTPFSPLKAFAWLARCTGACRAGSTRSCTVYRRREKAREPDSGLCSPGSRRRSWTRTAGRLLSRDREAGKAAKARAGDL